MTLYQGVMLFAQTTIWGLLPFTGLTRRMQGRLIERLYTGLLHRNDLAVIWQEDTGLESLLWVLFVVNITLLTADLKAAQSQLYQDVMQKQLLEKPKAVTVRLDITSLTGFVCMLKLFPWTDHFCMSRCALLWACISGPTVDIPSVSQLNAFDLKMSDSQQGCGFVQQTRDKWKVHAEDLFGTHT